MSRTSRVVAAVAAGAAALLVLSACTSGAADSAEIGSVTEGKLTIATGEPAYAPWMIDNTPENGEGFESAVAYAVAEEMGYTAEDVVWIRTPFESAIAPGPKEFDLNMQQFSATPERENAVDFSSPYYVTTQAIVANAGSEAANAKSIKDLDGTVFGVASGTTSFTAAEKVFGDTAKVQVFNNLDDVVAALQNGNIDALVTDLPGAFYVRDAQLDDGVIVGQLADEAGDEFAFLLPKGSNLTKPVSDAVDTLREDGTLDELAAEWIADQGAPVLK
ncbi:polar amino acid transport system substrate-binding protein [Leucobacter exalbidus]|uniref:Polar amino acid transport system substrate-binding protein n=1 Tax=Leucobacter exalbidus TaxID=662960 RepID=A0A940SZD5_9MICO|nr:ABC transporter substrate-binding protein [Leucobacter exalbidus]MBP1324795.1 polar amino acid transport system substrate-binding protein [Leucobacter exalbidus]